jgi:predicted thioesterase
MMFERVQPGLVGEVEAQVDPDKTARHLGSGDVSVLATPEMVRLMERAAVQAVDHLLPDGYRTVGIHVDVRHLAATPVGMSVRARAELVQVDGRKLSFRVEAFDDAEAIGEGSHRRMIIDLDRFRERAAAKGAGS